MDSDAIVIAEDKHPNSMAQLFMEFAKKFPIAKTLLLFIFIILILSDIFINQILSEVKGAVSYTNVTTTFGTVIQTLLIVVFNIFLNLIL